MTNFLEISSKIEGDTINNEGDFRLPFLLYAVNLFVVHPFSLVVSTLIDTLFYLPQKSVALDTGGTFYTYQEQLVIRASFVTRYAEFN